MRLFAKAFECQTHLPLEKCKQNIIDSFPQRRFPGWLLKPFATIWLKSLTESSNSLQFCIYQTPFPRSSHYVKLDAEVILLDADPLADTYDVRIRGHVYIPWITFLLSVAIVVMIVIVSVLLRSLPYLSVLYFLLLGFIIHRSIKTLQHREELAKIVCRVLSD
ncbi:MAG: hypothetical protein H6670_01555 [Anaerolineaceae bacterium]|nr:hypothetical protein [Anaerolineaceae bacterium]